jgi:hypothetical protein
MLVEFHSETNALLIIPGNRQERRSLELLYEKMLQYVEDVYVDGSVLHLRSDGVLEVFPLFPRFD